MAESICIVIEEQKSTFEKTVQGLAAEAMRLLGGSPGGGSLNVLCMEPDDETELRRLGRYGIKRVTALKMERGSGLYPIEALSKKAAQLIGETAPSCILTVQKKDTVDICARVASFLGLPLFTWAVDIQRVPDGRYLVTRCISNGYLFEEVMADNGVSPVVCLVPSMLTASKAEEEGATKIIVEEVWATGKTQINLEQLIEREPSELDIEEAEIIVAVGAGVGKGEKFEIIHKLAKEVGGAIACTRPVVDSGLLPYERQIGQTGKTVSPRLIINCGISGANEYTAGMETSQLVIAINKDPLARIFKFADLGIVGDVHEVLPLIIRRLEEIKGNKV